MKAAMKPGTVADLIVSTLKSAGAGRVYGLVGDSLNGITDAVRRDGAIAWMRICHEEVAAFAACGEAQVTGRHAVCAGSCRPGNLHLIKGLFNAHWTRVPVLAIAPQTPSFEIGSGYFQETLPQQLCKEAEPRQDRRLCRQAADADDCSIASDRLPERGRHAGVRHDAEAGRANKRQGKRGGIGQGDRTKGDDRLRSRGRLISGRPHRRAPGPGDHVA